MKSACLYAGIVLALCCCSQLEGLQNGTASCPSRDRGRVLSRKRRFLLFPPGANFIVTISGGKGSMFETPRGYNLVAEMDMYHPLPDYLYHATSLRLGTVARYPDETTTATTPLASATTAYAIHEPSKQEVQEYLAKHPETWIPTDWAADRTEGSLSKHSGFSSAPGVKYLLGKFHSQAAPLTYQSWKRKLWESTGSDRLYYNHEPAKRVRSVSDFGENEPEPSLWTEANKLNISQHLGWEHFHHYRDRRHLYDHLETTVPSFFGFHMRECLLRSICEARNLLPPKGRSMTVDILRVIFTYPLKYDLSDDYSRMMRDEKPNCGQLFSDRCPLSILQLILFGKFEL